MKTSEIIASVREGVFTHSGPKTDDDDDSPDPLFSSRLENELIQWASEMTVFADTLADIFPTHQIVSNQH